MSNRLSRSSFLRGSGAAAAGPFANELPASSRTADRIVDIHMDFDEKEP